MFGYTNRNGFSQTMCFFKNGLVNLFNLQFFDKDVQHFFKSSCRDILERRKEMEVHSSDLLSNISEFEKNDKNSGKQLAMD